MEFYVTTGETETSTLFSDKQLEFFANYVMKPVLDRISTLEGNIRDLLLELKDENRGYITRREAAEMSAQSREDRKALWRALWGILMLFVALGFTVLLNYMQIRAQVHP